MYCFKMLWVCEKMSAICRRDGSISARMTTKCRGLEASFSSLGRAKWNLECGLEGWIKIGWGFKTDHRHLTFMMETRHAPFCSWASGLVKGFCHQWFKGSPAGVWWSMFMLTWASWSNSFFTNPSKWCDKQKTWLYNLLSFGVVACDCHAESVLLSGQDKVPPHGASGGRLMGSIYKSCGINIQAWPWMDFLTCI